METDEEESKDAGREGGDGICKNPHAGSSMRSIFEDGLYKGVAASLPASEHRTQPSSREAIAEQRWFLQICRLADGLNRTQPSSREAIAEQRWFLQICRLADGLKTGIICALMVPLREGSTHHHASTQTTPLLI
jgi:hypothetical protein